MKYFQGIWFSQTKPSGFWKRRILTSINRKYSFQMKQEAQLWAEHLCAGEKSSSCCLMPMGAKNRKVADCSSREKVDLPVKNGTLNTKKKLIFALDFHWNRLTIKFTGVATTLHTSCRWQTCQTVPLPCMDYKPYIQKSLILCSPRHWHLPGVSQANTSSSEHLSWKDTGVVNPT